MRDILDGRYQKIVLALVVLASVACFPKTEQTTIVGTNIFPQPTPSASASPLCPLSRIELGTAGDATEVPRGSSVELVLSVFGPSGEIKPDDTCLSNVQASYRVTTSTGVPCEILGGGFSARVGAPTAATVGARCEVTASVGPHSSSRAVTVK